MKRQPTRLTARLADRLSWAVPLALLLGAASPNPSSAPAHPASHAASHAATPRQATQAAVVPPQPPHAWLFGTWTGGIFPPPSAMTAESCLSQPVVIFTRDVVLRATLTSETYLQRVIESVRTGPHGAEFRFTQPIAAAGPLDLAPADAPTGGFGCESPDDLHVERHTENEIAFPRCSDFPYPLVRCPAH